MRGCVLVGPYSRCHGYDGWHFITLWDLIMNKRRFLSSVGTATAGWLAASQAGPAMAATHGHAQPTLLTVSGALSRHNRGALDPVVDQMMGKHGIQFSQAFVFDAASLWRLPAHTIRPTLEYDGKVHTLRGPLLSTVLRAAGVPDGGNVQLGLRAVDGYNVTLSLDEVTRGRMLLATHIDGHPMALGGLGPQWAVWDADRLPHLNDKPLKERFAQCPWGLYHIDVAKA